MTKQYALYAQTLPSGFTLFRANVDTPALCTRLTKQYFGIGDARRITLFLSTEQDPDAYYVRDASATRVGSGYTRMRYKVAVYESKAPRALIARHMAYEFLAKVLRNHFGGGAWLSIVVEK